MAAAPRERQPALFWHDGISLLEGVVRAMRRFGVGWLSEKQHAGIADRAQYRFDGIFSAIQSRPHVVWFDNYYRRRYAINPEKGDISLNCTALAVLPLRSMPAHLPVSHP